MGEKDAWPLVFETKRLRVRVASPAYTEHYYHLWTNPRVMRNVGFPHGLRITREQITELLENQAGRIFDSRLVVLMRDTNQPVGECKLGWPNQEGISETDVKLLPQYWGNKYGVEIKQALVDYLFTHTFCKIIEATPNVNNIASIKMQEAVGAVRVGEDTWIPEPNDGYMVPVHHYIYRVFRRDWIASQEAAA